MTSTTNRQFSFQASSSIKLVGLILILSALVDYLVLLFPPNLTDRGWLIQTASSLVDRGVVPLVGMALVLMGYWMDSVLGNAPKSRNNIADLRLWVGILASLFGLLYLLIFPMHLNNTRLARRDALSEISQQAAQAETQLESQLGSQQFQQEIEQRKVQLRAQLTGLIQDEEQLNQVIAEGNLPPQILQVLEEARTNPAVLDEFLEQQADSLPVQLLTQIRQRQQELEDEAKTRSLKSSLQTGMSSLLLAIGYIALGWTGLKGLGLLNKGRRKPSSNPG
ncbi:hormogonium polysaccharide biosynthesis protein HpsJ [Limnospira sp. PMC 289.06]|uniref:hormogonium polysaccharide biosynthesis protein HpsJ n=1 Tax=Limnospira sp. PMC 289.06 TaxID=2981094 RepID=UPI0028E17D27|nr:HpsJ family protein [Limnospira sp. PMC 289.06]